MAALAAKPADRGDLGCLLLGDGEHHRMEIVAIGVDLWLVADAGLGDVLFWISLVFSLSMG